MLYRRPLAAIARFLSSFALRPSLGTVLMGKEIEKYLFVRLFHV